MTSFITTDPILLLLGVYYIVLGASQFAAPQSWCKLLEIFQQSEVIVLAMGMFALFLGLLITIFFATWATPGRVLLTIYGYIALIEAAIMLFKPEWMLRFIAGNLYQGIFKMSGALSLIIGLLFLVL